jgi:predicted acylesterase/phospholipase RssA
MTVLTLWRRGRRDVPAVTSGDAPRPRDVVVLSGGGSLGAAQVGALQAMFEAGVVPDAVVGCSVGALNAAFVAVDPTAARLAELEQVWRGLSRDGVFPDGRFTVARRLAGRQDHLYSPDGLHAIISACVPLVDLGDTAIPCHVVTTDLLAGQPVWWTSGDPVDVLAASACLPGLFPPVSLGGTLHVDGGVSCPVPTQRGLELGAARVWVLDVTRDFHGWVDERMTAMDVLLESFAISRAHLSRRPPVIGAGQQVIELPSLRVGRHDLRDFSKTPSLLAAGREAGRAMIAAHRDARAATLSAPPAPAGLEPPASATAS